MTTVLPEELARDIAAKDGRVTAGHGYAFGDRVAECDQALRAFVDRGRAANVSHAAATWVLDNFADLHTALRDIGNAIPKKYYVLLPVPESGASLALPRIERAAMELVDLTAGELDAAILQAFLAAYQEVSPLTLAELWAASHLARFALIRRVVREVGIAEPAEAVIRNAITSLRGLERVPWKNVVEKISFVERILRDDPSGDYARMDFDTRDMYRHAVEQCARYSRGKSEDPARAEERVASNAVRMAGAEGAMPSKHVGYWLIGKGLDSWRKDCGYRHRGSRPGRFILRHPGLCYLSSAALFTALIMAGAWWMLTPLPAWLPIWCLALLALPCLHVALSILNPLVTFVLPPRRLPRYDFSEGVPAEYKTFVVMPTLLLSRENVEQLLETIEIHYLANRDPNVLFALLTDFPDSDTPEAPNDGLIHVCAEGIERLNERYTPQFFMFHRPRKWNEGEARWMGRERKRGKLNDFNSFLLGHEDAFSTQVGDLNAVRGVRYVITLDSDTQLPRDTASKMIATLAHPLNRAVIDREKRIVREGFGLLQPRVGVSVQSSVKSRLARIYSGQVGFDPYATAVSDVYQDLYGRASFTGKGIYDVAAFEATAGDRFPDNTLLSHDLIEGEHVRVGLVTDQEVIDDFPARYEAFSKRKHRWVRGDWQILRWLLPRVPARTGGTERNPLGLISRWKIFDNLRRSLMELSLLIFFIAGWIVLPRIDSGHLPLAWTLTGLALFVLPVWFDLIVAAIRIPPPRYVRSYGREVVYRFARGHLDALLTLIFLPHQALMMSDAVARTLVRQFITHKHLLEWESMAAAESARSSRFSLSNIYLLCSPAIALVMMFSIPPDESWSNLAFALLELWLVAPLIALWLDAKPAKESELGQPDIRFLRDLALRTWRYFSDYAREENHWLAPDNVQENPPIEAHRASPTNIGLQLNANVSALDFGHITAEEFAETTQRTLASVAALPRYRGHLLNWNDTRDLAALDPRYVSSVDSGNFAASLIILKQACLELPKRPIVTHEELQGLRDHCERLRDELPAEARSHRIVRGLDSLARQLSSDPTDLFHWEGLLTESLASARQIAETLEHGGNAEVNYWADRFVCRIRALLAQLCHAAPWLCDPFEREFRFCFNRPALEPLLDLLRTPLAWSELPERYEAIGVEIGRTLASERAMHDLTRGALEALTGKLATSCERASRLLASWQASAATAGAWVEEMDFTPLFDSERKLLRIGCGEDGRPDESYYDLLASEARTAVLLGIAKGQMPREAWFHLGRKLTQWRGYRCLVSWSGTMFEYLMPNIFMRTWEGTLLHESCRSVVRIQRQHARERRIPWGISESAWNSRDSLLNYQYHAFGVPVIAARRDFVDRIVITPYATMLALTVDPVRAMENARLMAENGWIGKYGFFESVDFSPARRFGRKDEGTVVRAWMAHHQGMTLLAINAVVANGAMRKRFHADPLVQAAEYLLQERVPNLIGGDIEEAEETPAQSVVGDTEESVPDQLQKV